VVYFSRFDILYKKNLATLLPAQLSTLSFMYLYNNHSYFSSGRPACLPAESSSFPV
jgi:hypothetical protein